MIWGAAWLYKATNSINYWDYINANVKNLEKAWVGSLSGSNSAEFGWDSKHAGINVLLSKVSLMSHIIFYISFFYFLDGLSSQP